MDPVSLANAGGWTVAVAMGTAIGLGAVKGWWVPGWLHRREIKRGDELQRTVTELSTALLDEVRRAGTGRSDAPPR